MADPFEVVADYFKPSFFNYKLEDLYPYKVPNPFMKPTRAPALPRIVSRYGGKGTFYDLYLPYIYNMAKASNLKIFADCFGGGGTMAMAALMMVDDDTHEPLFDKVIYNDVDITVVSAFEVVKDKDRCEKLIDKILDTEYSEENYWKARKVSMALNLPEYDTNEQKKIDLLDSETKVKRYKAAYQITDAYIQRVLGSEKDCYSKETIRDIVVAASKEKKRLESGELSRDDIAYAGVIENAMSFNGDGREFRNVDAYDRSKIDFGKKMHDAAKRFRDITPLLDRLEVRYGDYAELMKDYGNECIYFCDPPYYKVERAAGAGNVYKHEFTVEQHIKLICDLNNQDNWLLCGYKKDEQEGLREAGVTANDINEIPEWQRRVYGILRDMQDVIFVDLGAITRGSSSIDRGDEKSDDKSKKKNKLKSIQPHEILWYRQRNVLSKTDQIDHETIAK